MHVKFQRIGIRDSLSFHFYLLIYFRENIYFCFLFSVRIRINAYFKIPDPGPFVLCVWNLEGDVGFRIFELLLSAAACCQRAIIRQQAHTTIFIFVVN